MLKKLLIPCFAVAAAFAIGSSGCGSSTNSTGAGGHGGGSAGSTATGGHGGAATGGTGGSPATGGTGGSPATGGTGGGTAGGAGGSTSDGGAGTTGTAGHDGGTAGSDGGTDAAGGAGGVGGGPNLTALEAMCVAKRAAANASTAYTAEEFCAVYADICGGQTFTGMLTSADCVATYTGWATKKIAGSTTVGVQNCVSYHVCNAQQGGTNVALHCPHAAGMGPCAQ